MKYALGCYKEQKIILTDLITGKRISPENVDGVILSSVDCHIHCLPTKLKKDEQLRSFCLQYVKSIHPGPYDLLEMDYLVLSSDKAKNILLCILDVETLKKYRELDKPLYIFFQFQLGNEKLIYLKSENYLESYNLDNKEHDIVEEGNRENKGITVTVDNINKLKLVYNKPLFESGIKKSKRNRIPIVLLLILLAVSSYMISEITMDLKQLKIENLSLQQHRFELIQIGDKTNSLSNEELDKINELYYMKRQRSEDFYSTIGLIAASTTVKTDLISISLDGNEFSIEGRTSDFYGFIEDLQNTNLFVSLSPNQISPGEDGFEVFSLSGVLK